MINLLESEDVGVLRNAAFSLRNLCNNVGMCYASSHLIFATEENQKEAAKYDAVPLLLKLLKSKYGKEDQVKHWCTQALVNICQNRGKLTTTLFHL